MADKKKTVPMFYPPDADGPREMILTNVGYFEKGKLTDVADLATAEDLVKRKKGPRIATTEDLAAVKKVEGDAAKADQDAAAKKKAEDEAAAKKLTGDGRETKPGEKIAIG